MCVCVRALAKPSDTICEEDDIRQTDKITNQSRMQSTADSIVRRRLAVDGETSVQLGGTSISIVSRWYGAMATHLIRRRSRERRRIIQSE